MNERLTSHLKNFFFNSNFFSSKGMNIRISQWKDLEKLLVNFGVCAYPSHIYSLNNQQGKIGKLFFFAANFQIEIQF